MADYFCVDCSAGKRQIGNFSNWDAMSRPLHTRSPPRRFLVTAETKEVSGIELLGEAGAKRDGEGGQISRKSGVACFERKRFIHTE